MAGLEGVYRTSHDGPLLAAKKTLPLLTFIPHQCKVGYTRAVSRHDLLHRLHPIRDVIKAGVVGDVINKQYYLQKDTTLGLGGRGEGFRLIHALHRYSCPACDLQFVGLQCPTLAALHLLLLVT